MLNCSGGVLGRVALGPGPGGLRALPREHLEGCAGEPGAVRAVPPQLRHPEPRRPRLWYVQLDGSAFV